MSKRQKICNALVQWGLAAGTEGLNQHTGVSGGEKVNFSH